MANSEHLILNRYKPLSRAGSGGFGTVQVAWDTRIQRKVAIKCIQLSEIDAARAALPGAAAPQVYDDTDGAADENLVRFLSHVPGLDEARTAAMLTDANIVAVYDFEIQGTTAYLIMEYVEGLTLTQLLGAYDDQLTLDIVAAVFAAISHALEVAHANQVLHLDIKPDNVLINEKGQVKVTDFGLATLADATGYGAAGGGTIGYMPLEQMRQENLDERCDEWALASVMYWMLVGKNPFFAPDLKRAEAAIEDAELVLPSLCWDDLSPEVDEILFCALDPDREQRFDSVDEFAKAFMPHLGRVKQGTKDLARLVEDAKNPESEPEEEVREVRPHIPLRYRITDAQIAGAGRVCGGVGSALLAGAAASLISVTAGLTNPLFWVCVVAALVLGVLKSHVGVLASSIFLGAGLIAHGAPALGIVFIIVSGLWWYFVGQTRGSAANVCLAAPIAGAVGLAPLVPLVSGFMLRPVRALVCSAYAAFMMAVLVALGAGAPDMSVSIPDAAAPFFGWNAFALVQGAVSPDIQHAFGSLLTAPSFWCGFAGWIGVSGLVSLIRLRPTRAFAFLSVLVGGAVLTLVMMAVVFVNAPSATTSLVGATSVGSGLLGMPALELTQVISLLVSVLLMIFACVLTLEPPREEEFFESEELYWTDEEEYEDD